MNKTLQVYTRGLILDGVIKLPESWQLIFKRMYSHTNLELPLADVIATIPEEKLDWALTQVENSLAKIAKEKAGQCPDCNPRCAACYGDPG